MIDPIKLCCIPVLPTVYSDSLSYYEELCKINTKINEIISTINSGFEDDIQTAIDKYFNRLMIDATYDSDSRTITLQRELSAGGEHIYSAENGNMTIL